MTGFQVECSAAVNGSGIVALQTENIFQPVNAFVHFVNPDGSVRAGTSGNTDVHLLGRLSSFVGVSSAQPGRPAWAPESWDAQGNLASTGPSRLGVPTIVEDPLGGMAVLVREPPAAVENYDELGRLRWRVELSPELGPGGGFAVDRLGNTFVMGDGANKAVMGQWIDHDGAAKTAFQLFGPQNEWNHIEGKATARVDSGLFIRADAWWQLESLQTSATPAPAWFVAAQPDGLAGVQLVRGGRAYGLIGFPAGDGCASTVEVFSPSGKSCGKVSFSSGPGACFWAIGSIGYDGTFVQRVPPPAGSCEGNECSCNWRWWTAFFR